MRGAALRQARILAALGETEMADKVRADSLVLAKSQQSPGAFEVLALSWEERRVVESTKPSWQEAPGQALPAFLDAAQAPLTEALETRWAAAKGQPRAAWRLRLEAMRAAG